MPVACDSRSGVRCWGEMNTTSSSSPWCTTKLILVQLPPIIIMMRSNFSRSHWQNSTKEGTYCGIILFTLLSRSMTGNTYLHLKISCLSCIQSSTHQYWTSRYTEEPWYDQYLHLLLGGGRRRNKIQCFWVRIRSIWHVRPKRRKKDDILLQ